RVVVLNDATGPMGSRASATTPARSRRAGVRARLEHEEADRQLAHQLAGGPDRRALGDVRCAASTRKPTGSWHISSPAAPTAARSATSGAPRARLQRSHGGRRGDVDEVVGRALTNT